MEDLITRPVVPDATPSRQSASSVIDALMDKPLDPTDIARLELLLPSTSVDIHAEIRRQHSLVQVMQGMVLSGNGAIMSEASAKDISAVISAFNSYLNLYLRSLEKLEKDKQMQVIEQAVVDAVSAMPLEIQEQYMSKLISTLEGS